MIALWVGIAAAAVPLPPYPDCAVDARASCPSDYDDWSLFSWIPEGSLETVRPAELALGSGISADVAFHHTLGEWNSIIAVLDSGIWWQESDLWSKIHLNAGELPLPLDSTGAENPDPDGNGILNLDDYASDSRVAVDAGDDVADDRLDPSDLIHTFSDGIDDDGNGYVDDIAGWDFFAGDNDPFSDPQVTNSDHGTGVMEEAAEAGEDGGGIGACPNCSILPVRVGDTFVTQGDRVGLGLAFAADSGAHSVAMAIGAMTWPSWGGDALRYAAGHGITLVGAAGDENGYHRNLPAAGDPVFYVHSIKSNTEDENNGAYSYFNTWNCNNFGPRVDAVAPSGACATGSVAKIAGSAGLIWSAGDERGLDLAPDEVKQLLIATVDDVNLTDAEREISGAWPSKPGWDAFFGHGRVNLGRAVEAVEADAIPPIARIDSPGWFTWAGDGKGVEIDGTVDAPRGTLASWVLEVGAGAEPQTWTTIASGTTALSGTIATADLPVSTTDLSVPMVEPVVDRLERAHDRLVQLRLTATDSAGLVAISRSGVWVDPDPDLLPGFPHAAGSSIESAVALANLDATPAWEIVFATSDGRVEALDGSGADLPGFPVWTDELAHADSVAWRSGEIAEPHEGILSGVAVGDIDGDGAPEVVTASLTGAVYAWNNDGTPVAGFPVHITGRTPDEFVANRVWDNGVAATPALGDVDGDGIDDIVIPAMDQRLYVWNGQGSLLPGYPLELCVPSLCGTSGTRIIAPAALGDIDGDGDLDAALGTNEIPPGSAGALYLVDLRSATVWDGYPVGEQGLLNQTVLPLIGEGHPAGVALADLDGDGDLELSSNAMLGSLPPIDVDGSAALDVTYTVQGFGLGTDFTEASMVPAVNDPAFGDLDGDGHPEFLTGGVGVQWLVSLAVLEAWDYQDALGAWDGVTGAGVPGFPRKIEDLGFLSAPAVGDVSGDGVPDVLAGSAGSFVHAWSATGAPIPGWPKVTGGWMLGGPSIGDVDGDGRIDVVAATRDGLVFAWKTAGDAGQRLQWPSNRHDARNTGNWETPIPPQPGLPATIPEDKGCKCDTRPVPGSLWLALIAWGCARRRSRRSVEHAFS